MSNKFEVNGRTIEIQVNENNSIKNIHTLRKEIIKWLSRIGITEDYVNIEYNKYGYEEPFASISWVVNGKEYYYECKTQKTATKCLASIEQLVHYEVIFIERGIKSFAQVMNQFKLGYDPSGPTMKTPREILNIPAGVNDFEFVKFKYKELAKKYHPDNKETGSENKFKELQEAYKSLENELK